LSGHIELFDWLRAIAIVAVVLLHTAALDWYTTPVASPDWQVLNVVDSSVRFSVPIFFMISGALFLQPTRNVTIRTVLTKNLPRLAIPFLVWSLFYSLVSTFGPRGDHSLMSFALRIILGHYHLWFLVALAGLYLATPLLRPLARVRSLTWYFVLLAGVFATVLPLVVRIPVIGPVVDEFLGTMQFAVVLGYSIYFMLGHLLFSARISPLMTLILGLAGACGFLITALGTSRLSLEEGAPNSLLYGYLTPNVLLASIGAFAVVKNWTTSRPPGVPRVVSWLSTCSFGIYLVHPFFQSVLEWMGITTASGAALVTVPLLAVGILVPSLLVAALIRRIPRVGTFLA
jgi:surface polysaccharide O-acyltransferase-like enzyme